MEVKHCVNCNKSKSLLECGLCHESVCKYCAEILPEDAFTYLTENQTNPAPEHLKNKVFCSVCFNNQVSEELQKYNELEEQAKNIRIFLANQGKETRFIRRIEKPIHVENALDENDVVMRLAFLAVKGNFNALVDVSIVSKKVRNEAYQTLTWSGTGVPVNMTASQLNRDK